MGDTSSGANTEDRNIDVLDEVVLLMYKDSSAIKKRAPVSTSFLLFSNHSLHISAAHNLLPKAAEKNGATSEIRFLLLHKKDNFP